MVVLGVDVTKTQRLCVIHAFVINRDSVHTDLYKQIVSKSGRVSFLLNLYSSPVAPLNWLTDDGRNAQRGP